MDNGIHYGIDPTVIIIRLTPDDVVEFNRLNDYSIDQIKANLDGKEVVCHFQKISEAEHKIFIPAFTGQFEAIVKWYSVADTYQVVIDKKKKTIFRSSIIIPGPDKSISETCFVKIIDFNEGGKANIGSDEFEEIYKRVCRLQVVSNINIQNQQEIWFKWIEAQKEIIKQLQEPFEVTGKPQIKTSVQPFKDKNGEPLIGYEVSVSIKETITSEYSPLEAALREYGINPSVDKSGLTKKDLFEPDGTIMLTAEEIEKVLDPLIKAQFSQTFEREHQKSAIIKLKNRIDYEINNYLESINWNVKVEIDPQTNFLIFYSKGISAQGKENIITATKEILIPKELIEKYQLVRKGVFAIIKATDETNNQSQINYSTDLRDGTYGRILEEKKTSLKKELIEKCSQLRSQGYKYASLYLGELFSYNPDSFIGNSFSEEFNLKIKRELIPYKEIVEFNPVSKTISFDFETMEELENLTSFLRSIKRFQFEKDPLTPSFRFKVKTNFVAKKSQKQLFYDKLSKLRGAEFISDLNKKVENPIEEDEEPVIRKRPKKPEFQFLGNLNSRFSNQKKLTFDIPSFFSNQKELAESVKKFIESEKANKVKFVQANLKGDEAKNS